MIALQAALAGGWGIAAYMSFSSLIATHTSRSPRLKAKSLVSGLVALGAKHRLMLLAATGLLVGVRLVAAVALVWWLVPWWLSRRAAASRAAEIEAAMPEMVELLTVALHGGLGLEEACRAVSARLRGLLADELNLCMTQIQRGVPFEDALVAFRERTGGSYRGVVDAILSTQRYGLPLAATLERLGTEAKAERRRQSEVRTRRLPVQMLLPLVLLFLPAVLLVVVVPVVGAAISQLTSVA